MTKTKSRDPLHGITLETLLTRLVENMGWEELGKIIRIRCFILDPSIKSSLTFLRKTPWARVKVEELYIYKLSKKYISLTDATPIKTGTISQNC
ncbi:MAG: DUF2132 domain-containing protein [Candidatus Omnitrophica bacterium]|nr:DUF2132 domain-containing protein [Candidatus Omnitrophota bacterium]